MLKTALRFIGLVLVSLWLIGERGRPIMGSTWRTIRSYKLKNILNLKILHGYIYGRWTRQYLYVLLIKIFPRLKERGWKWWTNRYHGKVLTPELAQAVFTLDHDISLRDLEQIIPYEQAREIVLSSPTAVAVYECNCRLARKQHCEPTQVCMIIGQPGVDFLLEHHPEISRRLTQAEALDLLAAEHARGHVHIAWFKDALNDRFFAICNCCACCCGGIEAMVKYGQPMVTASGFVAEVDAQVCVGCGVCADKCPFGAITVDETAMITWDKCLGCGVCISQCPVNALSLRRDAAKGTPMDVRTMR